MNDKAREALWHERAHKAYDLKKISERYETIFKENGIESLCDALDNFDPLAEKTSRVKATDVAKELSSRLTTDEDRIYLMTRIAYV